MRHSFFARGLKNIENPFVLLCKIELRMRRDDRAVRHPSTSQLYASIQSVLAACKIRDFLVAASDLAKTSTFWHLLVLET
jgi:hypothetical protein